MTIYLREKKSGNFEVSTKTEATHKFKSKKSLKTFFDGETELKVINDNGKKVLRKVRVSSPETNGKIIKNTYSRSQTYYESGEDFLKSL